MKCILVEKYTICYIVVSRVRVVATELYLYTIYLFTYYDTYIIIIDVNASGPRDIMLIITHGVVYRKKKTDINKI